MDTVIQFEGTIYENGYGLIAQKVMRDRDLHPTAKSIYAYLCSFAGVSKDGERTAFPGVSLMMSELNIKTEDTYYKYRKQLLQKGYIKIDQMRRERSKFHNNIYKIVAVPIELPPEVKVEQEQSSEESPSPKKSSTVEPYPKLSSTVKSSSVKSGTNITSLSITSSINLEEEEEDGPAGIIKLFKENFKTCNPAIEEELVKWTTKLPVDVIKNEIVFAAKSGAETFHYLERMLVEDELLKIDSIQRLEIKREDHKIANKKKSQTKTSSSRRSSNKPVREEKLPGWHEEAQKEREEQERAAEAVKSEMEKTPEQLEAEKQDAIRRFQEKYQKSEVN